MTDGERRTLVVVLAHPDDEVGVAGAVLAQRARGDRVVLLFLTRGEMTEALGPLEPEEVARRRVAMAEEAAGILGAETLFLDFPDTRLRADPEAAARVARVLARLRPDGVLTWGDGWVRGMRHPDHEACGKIARDAVILARIGRVVEPEPPHRAFVPLFTLRGPHSTLPAVAVDVGPYRERILKVADHYFRGIGFGDPEWLEERLARAGARWGVRWAEEYDAWETEGGLVPALLPGRPIPGALHPDWREREGR